MEDEAPKACERCSEENRRAVTLMCDDDQREVCTIGIDPFEKEVTVQVRVGDELREFAEPVSYCPWCGREL